MTLSKSVLYLAVAMIFLGATQASMAAESPTSITESDTSTIPSIKGYTFIAPGHNDPKLEEFACGIRFGFSQVINSVEGSRLAELKRTGPETAELTTFTGSDDFRIGKGVLHEISAVTARDETKCTVKIVILNEKPFKRGSFMNLWKAPPFTSEDVLVQTHKFLYQPSFISPYPATSLIANFERLAVKGCNNVGYGAASELPRDLRGNYDGVYCVKVDGKYIPTRPDCRPYRDGSKCTVLAVIAANRSERTFDARPSADSLRKAIEAILQD